MRSEVKQRNNRMIRLIKKTGSIGRAAERLHVSRQALDDRIKRYHLEDDVNKILDDIKRVKTAMKIKAKLKRCRICYSEYLPVNRGRSIVCSKECKTDYYVVRFVLNGQTKTPNRKQMDVLEKIFKGREDSFDSKEPLPASYFERAKKAYSRKVIRIGAKK